MRSGTELNLFLRILSIYSCNSESKKDWRGGTVRSFKVALVVHVSLYPLAGEITADIIGKYLSRSRAETSTKNSAFARFTSYR